MRSIVLFVATLVACQDQPQPQPKPSAPTAISATATVDPTATPSVAAVPTPTPKPLDVEELKTALKCGKANAAGPCNVLGQFAECKKWDPVTQSGDGRWLGRGYVVEKGAYVEELSLVRTRRVPMTEVGPGQLPVKVAITNIPNDLSTEREHAEKAIRAYERGDVTTKFNLAVEYIKKRDEWPEAFTTQAEGNQVFVAAEGGAHLCAREGESTLLAIKRAANRQHPADGVYAILWPVSW
jgi:hypothetical protein